MVYDGYNNYGDGLLLMTKMSMMVIDIVYDGCNNYNGMVIDIVFVTCFTNKTETQEGPCETFLFLWENHFVWQLGTHLPLTENLPIIFYHSKRKLLWSTLVPKTLHVNCSTWLPSPPFSFSYSFSGMVFFSLCFLYSLLMDIVLCL